MSDLYVFFIILKFCISQTDTIFNKHKGEKVADKVKKFPISLFKYLLSYEFLSEFSSTAYSEG